MGEFNIKYIPAATLYLNPGITREEYIELLNQIKIACYCTYTVIDFDVPLEFKHESQVFHGGIFELSKILNLNHKIYPLFLTDVEKWYEKDPLRTRIGDLIVQPTTEKNKWISPTYFVTKNYEEVIIEEKKNLQHNFYDEPIVGKDYKGLGVSEYTKITKINSLKKEIENGYDKFIVNYDCKLFKYKTIFDIFTSEKKLGEKYPQYNIERKVNWNISEGTFGGIPMYVRRDDVKNIKWEKINNKYYLQNNLEESDYTSIIITSEAIRKKMWGLFQFHGYCLTQKFLIENEESYNKYNQAIIDYEISEYAKEKKLTNTDLLRLRLENNLSQVKTPRLSDKDAFNIIYHEAISHHGLLDKQEHPPTLKDCFFKNYDRNNPFAKRDGENPF
jgi:hypothetical protein